MAGGIPLSPLSYPCFPSLCAGPRTFVAVGEEEYPAPLTVEGREVVHNHPRILGDAAAKHTHPGRLQLGGVIFRFNFSFDTHN